MTAHGGTGRRKPKDHSLTRIRVREVAPGKWEAVTKIRVVVKSTDPAAAVERLQMLGEQAVAFMFQLDKEVREQDEGQPTLPGTETP